VTRCAKSSVLVLSASLRKTRFGDASCPFKQPTCQSQVIKIEQIDGLLELAKLVNLTNGGQYISRKSALRRSLSLSIARTQQHGTSRPTGLESTADARVFTAPKQIVADEIARIVDLPELKS
jgi:hypothetical protein